MMCGREMLANMPSPKQPGGRRACLPCLRLRLRVPACLPVPDCACLSCLPGAGRTSVTAWFSSLQSRSEARASRNTPPCTARRLPNAAFTDTTPGSQPARQAGTHATGRERRARTGTHTTGRQAGTQTSKRKGVGMSENDVRAGDREGSRHRQRPRRGAKRRKIKKKVAIVRSFARPCVRACVVALRCMVGWLRALRRCCGACVRSYLFAIARRR